MPTETNISNERNENSTDNSVGTSESEQSNSINARNEVISAAAISGTIILGSATAGLMAGGLVFAATGGNKDASYVTTAVTAASSSLIIKNAINKEGPLWRQRVQNENSQETELSSRSMV